MAALLALAPMLVQSFSVSAKMMQCAIDWGLIESNPARGIRRYRETRRDRFLSESEFARLGATLRQVETDGKEHRFIVAARGYDV